MNKSQLLRDSLRKSWLNIQTHWRDIGILIFYYYILPIAFSKILYFLIFISTWVFLQYVLCFNRCTKFLCHKSLSKSVITSALLLLSDPRQRILPHYLASLKQTQRTYVSEAIPVLDLAAVLWNGGQPLLVFHEIPRFFRLFNALHIGLDGGARQHHQRDEKAHYIRDFHHGSGQKKKSLHTPAVGLPLVRRRMLRLGWNYQLISL